MRCTVPSKLRPQLFLAATLSVSVAAVPATDHELSPLVVTALKAELPPEDVKASFSIVTAEDIRAFNSKDVFEAIRRTTGVTVGANSSSIAGRKSIQIRGMDSSQVLMLVDGKRLTNTDSQIGHSNFQLNPVPMEAIERIEVIRGPMSSLYGSAGMAGVVNIVTKQASDAWYSSIDASVGTIDQGEGGDEYRVGFSTAGPLSQALGVKLSVETSEIEATPDKDGGDDTELEGNDIDAISTGLTYSFTPDHRLSLNVDQSREDRLLDEPYYEIERQLYALEYQGKIAGAKVDVKAYESASDNLYLSSSAPYYHYLTDRIYSVDIVKALSSTNQLIAGFEHRNEEYEKDYEDPERSDFNDGIHYWSLFAQDDISLLEGRLGVVLGLRYDNHERFGDELSPKVYVDYGLTPSNRLGFGYGHGFKAPTLTQSSDDYLARPHSRTQFIGNSDLKPETSNSYELTWKYDDGEMRAGAALFYNDITDLIDSTLIRGSGTSSDPSIYQYSNIHEAKTMGIELEIARPLSKSLDFAVNLTGLRTEDGEYDGKALTKRPELFGNLRLTHHYAPWNLRTTLNWEYIGEQYMAPDEEDPVPGYSLVDLTFLLALNKRLELRAGVTNIGDVRLADKSENFADAEERGRFYFAGVNLTF